MFFFFGLFICLAVHLGAAYIAAERAGLTPVAARVTAGPAAESATVEGHESSREVWLSQLAGLAAAYVVAALAFFTGLQLAGAEAPTTRIVVVPDKAASRAGLQSGDRVLTIAGLPVSSWDELKTRLLAAPRDVSTDIVAERYGRPITVQVTPDASGRIGILASEERQPRAWQSSLGPALASPLAQPLRVLRRLWASLNGEHTTTLSGPIGIVRSTRAGLPAWQALFILLAPSVSAAWPATLLAAAIVVSRRRYL